MRAVGTFVIVFCLASFPPTDAANFAVNSAVDAVDQSPGNGACATLAGTCTLRAAIQEANALPGPDAVTLPVGTFRLGVTGAGENAAATGDLDVTQPITISGAGASLTVVDGISADRVFHAAPGSTLTLRQLTVRNGNEPGFGGGLAAESAPVALENVAFVNNRSGNGGAVFAESAGLTVRGGEFAGNVGTVAGGAIVHAASTSALDVVGALFEDNRAPDGDGGAVFYDGSGTVAISGTTFRRNLAHVGGALHVVGTGAVTLADTTIESCRAADVASSAGGFAVVGARATLRNVTLRRNGSDGSGGGGTLVATGDVLVAGGAVEDNVAADGDGGLRLESTTGNVTVEGTAVRRNTALTFSGGGLRVQANAGAVALRDVLVEDNAARDSGGAAVVAGGTVLVDGSRFLRNLATADVGGLLVQAGNAVAATNLLVQGNQAAALAGASIVTDQTVDVQRSTFADNVALDAAGGGLGLTNGAATLVNCTFSGNWARDAGAGLLATGNTVVVANGTFADNTSSTTGAAVAAVGATVTVRASAIAAGPVASCVAAIASDGDNVDQDGSCGLAGPRDRVGVDPRLGPLADNGGPTPTHEPLSASPLIDASGGPCPTTDQRGIARPTDGDGDGTPACDVGAVEVVDECPSDPKKRLPGLCGCDVADVDANENGAIDCLINPELKAQIATLSAVARDVTGDRSDADIAAKSRLTALADTLLEYCVSYEPQIVKNDPKAKVVKLARKARKTLRALRKGKGAALARKKTRAGKALDALDRAVAS